MGWVLSKFRRRQTTMEVLTKLEADMTKLSQFKASTVVWQKKVVGHLVTYSIVLYLMLACLAYFKLFPAAQTRRDQVLLLLPFLVFPGLIWALRRLLTWWYHRKVRRDEAKLEELKQKKLRLLDEVMEKETYKVAKEILDKFGGTGTTTPSVKPILTSLPGRPQPPATDTQLRRRQTGPPDLNRTAPVTSLSSKPGAGAATPARTPAPQPGPAPPRTQSGIPQPGPPARPLPGPPGPPGPPGMARTAPGPPLPRPMLPRERGYLDKFVEFLVGDGPSNRYALICRQCESHNGMALREEFEYVAYRCCYCYYWNPARKQRPVAPRLAAERAVVTDESSSESQPGSRPSTAPHSRRDSGAGLSLEREVEILEQDREEVKVGEEDGPMGEKIVEGSGVPAAAVESETESSEEEAGETVEVTADKEEDAVAVTAAVTAEEKETESKVYQSEMEIDS